MTPPKNIFASVRQRLLNQAKRDRRPFNELLQYNAMERFLYRLSQSVHDLGFGQLMPQVDVVDKGLVRLGGGFFEKEVMQVAANQRFVVADTGQLSDAPEVGAQIGGEAAIL